MNTRPGCGVIKKPLDRLMLDAILLSLQRRTEMTDKIKELLIRNELNFFEIARVLRVCPLVVQSTYREMMGLK